MGCSNELFRLAHTQPGRLIEMPEQTWADFRVLRKAKKRISEEINMLKNLKHPKIIAFINAWTNKEKEQV